MSHGETGHGTQNLGYLGLPGELGTPEHSLGCARTRAVSSTKNEANDAVVAELSILWQRVSEIERGPCDINSTSCALFPR